MEDKTARLIGTQEWLLNTAHIYELSEPVSWSFFDWYTGEELFGQTSHVIVSAGIGIDTGLIEVMSWACDRDGEFVPDPKHRGNSLSQVIGTWDYQRAVEALGFDVLDDGTRSLLNNPDPVIYDSETSKHLSLEWRSFESDLFNRRRQELIEELSALRVKLMTIDESQD